MPAGPVVDAVAPTRRGAAFQAGKLRGQTRVVDEPNPWIPIRTPADRTSAMSCRGRVGDIASADTVTSVFTAARTANGPVPRRMSNPAPAP